jgi:hypothetical protein
VTSKYGMLGIVSFAIEYIDVVVMRACSKLGALIVVGHAFDPFFSVSHLVDHIVKVC